MITNRDELARTARHDHACEAIRAGIEAAHPRTVLKNALSVSDGVLTIDGTEYDLDRYREVAVLGGGNAAGTVAVALEELLGDRIAGGLVVTDDPRPTDRIEVAEGTHPLPSEVNVEGTRELLERAVETGEETLVLGVVTGGGSALMCAPVEELSLAEYRELTTALLESGASIDEINAVRKHVSALKGGQLARALAPATTVGLVFSDVVGNRLDVITSGPLSPDGSTYDDALAMLDRYDIDPPAGVEGVLSAGADSTRQETPGEGDSAFEGVSIHVLADNRTAIDAAGSVLEECGYTPVVLSAEMEGEAGALGRTHGAIVREWLRGDGPIDPPLAVLSGGEATVTVTGDGAGGPNQEFALACGLDVRGTDALVAAVDTDGIDGPTDAAGALVSDDDLADPESAASALEGHDVYPYLDQHGLLVRTGQTGTNVNDLRLVLAGNPE
ncbi:MAG: glycerate kinase type-2 family protein [Natrialbaceae archaeon]